LSITYVRKTNDDKIIGVADRLAGRLQQALIDAVGVASGSISLQELTKAIEAGNTNAILDIITGSLSRALAGQGLAAGKASLQDAAQMIFSSAAKTAVGEMPASISTALSMNLMNQNAVSFLDKYTFDTIRGITNDTRGALTQVLTRAFSEGGSPEEIAREMRQMIGLTAAQDTAIANYRRALESGTSSGLKDALARSLRDGRYDRSLLRAIQTGQGMSADKIDKLTERYRARYLQYRANAIARTESIRVANAGQMEAWRQAREQGLLDGAEREWQAAGDDRDCEVCDGLDGEVVGFDEPFSTGVMHPPQHTHCRCGVKLKIPKKERAAA